jgi:hypothetical protein
VHVIKFFKNLIMQLKHYMGEKVILTIRPLNITNINSGICYLHFLNVLYKY